MNQADPALYPQALPEDYEAIALAIHFEYKVI
jgi:hypothetical protein